MFPSFGGRFGSQDLGSAGVAPASRLATAHPGGFGSPSVPTTGDCPSVGWTWQGEREKSRARGSEKAWPSRGSYGPKAKSRHDGAPKGERPSPRARPLQGGTQDAPFGALSPSLKRAMFGGHQTKKFRAARKPIPCVRNQDEAQHEKNSMKRPKPAPESDGMPEDINEFRRELLQRMNNMLQEWRTCGQTVCRRARKCVAKNLACSSKPAPIDRRKAARAKFLLKRALEARLAACPYDDNEEVKTPVADSGQRASNSAGPHQAPKVRPRSKTTAPAAQAARPPQTKVSRSTELARSRKG